MKEETTICQRLTKEGADSVMLEQYQHYQETGNMQGQYALAGRFQVVNMVMRKMLLLATVKRQKGSILLQGYGRGKYHGNTCRVLYGCRGSDRGGTWGVDVYFWVTKTLE